MMFVLGFVLGVLLAVGVCAIVWRRSEPEAFPAYELRRSVWDVERQAVREMVFQEWAAQRKQSDGQQDLPGKPADEEEQA